MDCIPRVIFQRPCKAPTAKQPTKAKGQTQVKWPLRARSVWMKGILLTAEAGTIQLGIPLKAGWKTKTKRLHLNQPGEFRKGSLWTRSQRDKQKIRGVSCILQILKKQSKLDWFSDSWFDSCGFPTIGFPSLTLILYLAFPPNESFSVLDAVLLPRVFQFLVSQNFLWGN